MMPFSTANDIDMSLDDIIMKNRIMRSCEVKIGDPINVPVRGRMSRDGMRRVLFDSNVDEVIVDPPSEFTTSYGSGRGSASGYYALRGRGQLAGAFRGVGRKRRFPVRCGYPQV